jgi:hypothetical protein
MLPFRSLQIYSIYYVLSCNARKPPQNLKTILDLKCMNVNERLNGIPRNYRGVSVYMTLNIRVCMNLSSCSDVVIL